MVSQWKAARWRSQRATKLAGKPTAENNTTSIEVSLNDQQDKSTTLLLALEVFFDTLNA